MISVDEAIKKIKAEFALLGSEKVFLDRAVGRILAQDVAAQITYPPLPISAMDGYAVLGKDVNKGSVNLTQIGVSKAGEGFKGKLKKGQAVRIFTGAPIPDGADTVVIQENIEILNGQINVKQSVPSGKFVRSAGLDFSVGDKLLNKSQTLSPRDIGLLAAMNVSSLKVRRKPRVAVIATGDELVFPGESIGPHQIVSSNSFFLCAYIRLLGGEPQNIGIAQDNIDSIKSTLQEANRFDLIITIGGASVGDFDLVQKVLGGETWNSIFYRIAMRPGKPTFFGIYCGTPLIGLPGNPVSAGVVSSILLPEAMSVMMGNDSLIQRANTALLGNDLCENDDRQDYLRADLKVGENGALIATPYRLQDSSMMQNFAKAKCLVIRPPFIGPSVKGDIVNILKLLQT